MAAVLARFPPYYTFPTQGEEGKQIPRMAKGEDHAAVLPYIQKIRTQNKGEKGKGTLAGKGKVVKRRLLHG